MKRLYARVLMGAACAAVIGMADAHVALAQDDAPPPPALEDTDGQPPPPGGKDEHRPPPMNAADRDAMRACAEKAGIISPADGSHERTQLSTEQHAAMKACLDEKGIKPPPRRNSPPPTDDGPEE